MEVFMGDHAAALGATKTESTLLVLFIPSHDRHGNEIEQDYWVDEALRIVGTHFHGGTAFPQGRGVWRDDAQGGILLYDNPIVIQCYTREELLEMHAQELRTFLVRMGTETRQGAVGLVIDQDYLEIEFPLTREAT
jgi:hypothetical protein